MNQVDKVQSEQEERGRSFTGQRFSRTPRRSVLWSDALARWLITVSGIGSIGAVTLVGLFLAWVALPLFLPTSITPNRPLPPVPDVSRTTYVAEAIDNYGIMSWGMTAEGEVIVRALSTGKVLDRIRINPTKALTAWSFGTGTGQAALGYADGSAQIIDMAWQTSFLAPDEAPATARNLVADQASVWQHGLLVRTPEGQLRHQKLVVSRNDPLALGEGSIDLIDLARTPSGLVLAALDSAQVFHHRKLTIKTNMLTGKTRVRARGGELALAAEERGETPPWVDLRLNDTGDLALLIRQDGQALRLMRNGRDFAPAGRQTLLAEGPAVITASTFLSGRTSLAVGDSEGGVTVWFPVWDQEAQTQVWRAAHKLPPGPAPVSGLAGSERSRLLAVGYADGTVRLYNATTERLLGSDAVSGQHISALAIAPREDLLLVTGQTSEGLWSIDAEYGDFSVGALFRPIWYEGMPKPGYAWQSSAASDSFEPKMSFMPLIFGTLKATFYSLLFGLPLAFLAAIYTSEFLDKNTRARVKPVIEIMASLPSVVLGFLAALVVAPWVEGVVVEVMAVMLAAPLSVLLGAHLWQLLPRRIRTRRQGWRPLAVLLSLVLGACLAWSLAPHLAQIAFAGDFKAWLDGRVGSGTSGWFLLLLAPVSALVVWLNFRHGEGLIRSRGRQWSELGLGLLDLGRFVAAVVVTLGTTWFLSWLVNASGWDPRGSLFDTYVQRNALVVGLAMGFAVIPLIYTISEDALVAVPDHLRAASLGAGATTWQTAIRVVVPPAMSGLFSAAMIGLGRAVGETMIVLMAAGNTPILDLNIFNGFRTLSANLAVELPEAVKDSTHYRTLFLAALTLFVMTFVLNTVAEAVRQRFRGKTSRL